MPTGEKDEWGEEIKVTPTNNTDEWGEEIVVSPKQPTSSQGAENGVQTSYIAPPKVSPNISPVISETTPYTLPSAGTGLESLKQSGVIVKEEPKQAKVKPKYKPLEMVKDEVAIKGPKPITGEDLQKDRVAQSDIYQQELVNLIGKQENILKDAFTTPAEKEIAIREIQNLESVHKTVEQEKQKYLTNPNKAEFDNWAVGVASILNNGVSETVLGTMNTASTIMADVFNVPNEMLGGDKIIADDWLARTFMPSTYGIGENRVKENVFDYAQDYYKKQAEVNALPNSVLGKVTTSVMGAVPLIAGMGVGGTPKNYISHFKKLAGIMAATEGSKEFNAPAESRADKYLGLAEGAVEGVKNAMILEMQMKLGKDFIAPYTKNIANSITDPLNNIASREAVEGVTSAINNANAVGLAFATPVVIQGLADNKIDSDEALAQYFTGVAFEAPQVAGAIKDVVSDISQNKEMSVANAEMLGKQNLLNGLNGFMNATTDAIIDLHNKPISVKELRNKSVEIGKEFANKEDFNERKGALVAQMSMQNSANVKAITDIVSKAPDVIKDIVNENVTDEAEKAELLQKIDNVYRMTNPKEKVKTEIGLKIKTLQDEMLNLNEDVSDPVKMIENRERVKDIQKEIKDYETELIDIVRGKKDKVVEIDGNRVVEQPMESPSAEDGGGVGKDNTEAKKNEDVNNQFTEAGNKMKETQDTSHLGNFILDNAEVGDEIKYPSGNGYEIVSVSTSKRTGRKTVEIHPFEIEDDGSKLYGDPIFVDSDVSPEYRSQSEASNPDKGIAGVGFDGLRDVFQQSFTNSKGERIIEQAEYVKKSVAEEKVQGGEEGVQKDLDRAKEIANDGSITNYVAEELKNVANTDEGKFKEYLNEIAEQAMDEKSRETTIKAYGQELVDIAEKLYEAPTEKTSTSEVAETKTEPTTPIEESPVFDEKNRTNEVEITNTENNGTNNGTENATSKEENGNTSKLKAKIGRGRLPKSARKVKNKDYIKALSHEVTALPDKVMQYFIAGGKINASAIKELYGIATDTPTKEAITPVGELRQKIDLVKRDAPSIKQLAHSIWENMTPEEQNLHTDQDVRNAIEDVLNSHNTRRSMVEKLNETYGGADETILTGLDAVEKKFYDDMLAQYMEEVDALGDAESERQFNIMNSPEFLAEEEARFLEQENNKDNELLTPNNKQNGKNENGVEKGGTQGNENESESVQSAGEEGRKQIDKQKEGELLTPSNDAKIAKAAKVIAKKIREGKIIKPDEFSSQTPASLVWDSALEVVAKTIEVTGDVAQAIADGLEHIRNSDWYKSLDDDKKARVEKVFEDSFKDEEGNLSGIKNADTAKIREKEGMPEYEGGYELTKEEAKQAAKKFIKEGGDVKKIIRKIKENRNIDLTESAVIGEYLNSLDKNYETTGDEKIRQERNDLIDALEKHGTGASETFTGRQLIFEQQDNLASFITEAEKAQGYELTPEQIEVETNAYKELKKKNKELEDAIQAEREQHAKDIAELGYNKARAKANKASKKTHEEHVTDRSAIVNEMRNALKALRGNLNSSVVPYLAELKTIAPYIKRLALDYANEGVDKLDVVVNNIHANVKDIIDGIKTKDIIDVLAGEHDEVKETKARKLTAIRQFEREAELLKKIAEARKGLETSSPKTRGEKSDRIKELEQKLKDIRKTNRTIDRAMESELAELAGTDKNPEKINEARQKRLQKQIDKLKEDLKTGNYLNEEPPKQKPIFSRKTMDLQDERIALEKAIKIRRFNAQQQRLSSTGLGKGVDVTKKVIKEALGVKRLLQTFLDWSVLMRQMMPVTANLRHAKITGKALAAQAKSTFNTARFDRLMDDIHKDELYHDAVSDGIVFNDLNTGDAKHTNEEYGRSFLFDLPIIGEALKGSNRAADAALNTARIELYKKKTDELKKQGITRETDPELFKAMGSWVMNLTGRGKMANFLEHPQAQRVLGSTFYGARLMASRFNILNPKNYIDAKALLPLSDKSIKDYDAVKIDAIKDMLGFAGGYFLTAASMVALGAAVSLDPDDPDFLQVRFGNKVYDLTGGVGSYLRTAFRWIDAFQATFTEEENKAHQKTKFAYESTTRFFRNKLAPNASYITNKIWGKDPVGNDFDPYDIFKAYPIYIEDTYEAIKQDGVSALATVLLPNLVGLGYGNYGNKANRDKERLHPSTKEGLQHKYSISEEDLSTKEVESFKKSYNYELIDEAFKEEAVYNFAKKVKDINKSEVLSADAKKQEIQDAMGNVQSNMKEKQEQATKDTIMIDELDKAKSSIDKVNIFIKNMKYIDEKNGKKEAKLYSYTKIEQMMNRWEEAGILNEKIRKQIESELKK